MRRTIGVFVLSGLIVGTSIVLVQAQSEPNAVGFEVASIKENRTNDTASPFRVAGEQFTATNMPLRDLVAFAYQLPPSRDRIVGLPDWTRTERYDVVAKAPAGTVLTLPNLFEVGSGKPSTAALMVRGLLAQRFQLRLHTEARGNSPGYVLVMARADRKQGPNLVSCSKLSDPTRCGARGTSMQLRGRGESMAMLATMLSLVLQQPVVDRTDLEGEFDVTLNYAPVQPLGQARPVASDAPSVFTALEEQLGLKLQPTREPELVFVIDHVERPAPD
jgi:uncharacterized protein (TIGR03435 family)